MSNREPKIMAVVPVRRFAESKRRLSAVLSSAERSGLGRAMLADVLAATARSGCFAETIVITDESDLSPPEGVHLLHEDRPTGLNAAIAFAAEHLVAGGAQGMIVIPADLPHLLAKTLESCRDALAANRSAVLVPAVSDGGTNILGLRPAGLIAPAFGPDSFARHAEALRAVGINPLILKDSEARYDIDRPEDLARFLALGTSTRTQEFLSGIRLGARLAAGKSLETQA